MDDKNNNDSLSSMNSLFGTNINVDNKNHNKVNDKPKENIPNNNNVTEEKDKSESIKPNDNNAIEEKDKSESIKPNNNENIKPENTTKEEKKEEEYKPIIEPTIKPVQEEKKEEKEEKIEKETLENTGLIGELIDTAEHFDFSKVKFNIALLGFIISLVGAVLYNLILTIPGVILSYLAYKKTAEGKLTNQDKLISVLGIALGVCCVISLIITKISTLFY